MRNAAAGAVLTAKQAPHRPGTAQRAGEDGLSSVPTLVTIGMDVAVVLALLLVVLSLVSILLPGPEQGAAEQSERLQPLVDDLARRIGLDWQQHWMSQLEALMLTGKSEEAVGEYREKSGVTWDEAHQAIGDWMNNEPERKLRAVLQHLQEGQAAAFPADGR
jgi:hypothetical protein